MSVADQLATEDRIVYAALVAAAVAAFVIWRIGRRYAGRGKPRHLAGPSRDRLVDSPTHPARRIAGVSSGQILDTVARIGGPVPPAGQIDDLDYVARALYHQQCHGSPCLIHHRYTDHCRCGHDWICEHAGPLNTDDAMRLPRQRDGEPFNRQDDPGRGWW